jgi:hypothetical protein
VFSLATKAIKEEGLATVVTIYATI